MYAKFQSSLDPPLEIYIRNAPKILSEVECWIMGNTRMISEVID